MHSSQLLLQCITLHTGTRNTSDTSLQVGWAWLLAQLALCGGYSSQLLLQRVTCRKYKDAANNKATWWGNESAASQMHSSQLLLQCTTLRAGT
jgi:hypothetical protein